MMMMEEEEGGRCWGPTWTCRAIRCRDLTSSPPPRTYALRRVRDGFRANRHVDNPKTLDELLVGATESLALIKRQVGLKHTTLTPQTSAITCTHVMPVSTVSVDDILYIVRAVMSTA